MHAQRAREVLGVSAGASPDDLKSAFRKLAMEHHPDKNGGSEEATARFQEINEAYQVLTRPEAEQTQTENEFHDWQQYVFHTFRRQQEEIYRRRVNNDVITQVDIGLEQVLKGCEIEVRTASGQILNVKVPKGINNGQQLRVSGGGMQRDASYPPGDLYVVIRVQDHSAFVRVSETTLLLNVPVDSLEAVVGGEIEITALDGETIIVPFPAGVQTDHRIIVSGRGLPPLNDEANRRGDLIVNLRLVTPVTLTERHRELVNRISKILPLENPNP